MIIHGRGVSADEAFAMTSQHANRKLRAVALDVAAGRLPIDGLHRLDGIAR